MVQNLYDLLEVSPRARLEVIKAAYRELIKKYHPDNVGGDKAIAQILIEAYGTLSNPTKREVYDKSVKGAVKGSLKVEYQDIELIAEGGFGETYKAKHILTKEPVCIKHCSKISPQHENILTEEAKAMWDLRHFSIPAIRNLLKLEDGTLALIMSFIPGPTLEQVIKKTGHLEPEHVAWITERALNVLRYMHYHGVVHGDIKPQNIIIQPKNHTVVLVDFGLSMIKPTGKTDNKGYTPHFASPEQIKGLTLLPESDFYSLGMTMIYALSGGLEQVHKKEVPASVPEPLCKFISKLIAINVLSRPNWGKEDLCEEIQKVRKKCFGRSHSEMKPIPGVGDK